MYMFLRLQITQHVPAKVLEHILVIFAEIRIKKRLT